MATYNYNPVPYVKTILSPVTNGTTTAAELTDLTTLVGVGTWVFKYYIIYQDAATTTGIKFSVNHTGTVTDVVYNMYGASTVATPAGAASQATNSTVTSFNVYSKRALATNGSAGPTVSNDSANADSLMIIDGIMVVTAPGNIALYHGSEVAANTTVETGSALILQQVA